MPTEHLRAPGILVPLAFDPAADLLGTGTVAQVFRVTLDKHQTEGLPVRLARRALRAHSD